MGSKLFDTIGCNTCHVRTLVTAPAGATIDGGTVKVPAALADKTFHPYSDFLLHNVGTGDGIAIAMDAPAERSHPRFPQVIVIANSFFLRG